MFTTGLPYFNQKIIESRICRAHRAALPFEAARPRIAMEYPVPGAFSDDPTRIVESQLDDYGGAGPPQDIDRDRLRPQCLGRMEGKTYGVLADSFGAPIHAPGTAARAKITGLDKPPDREGAVAHDDDRDFELVAGQEFLCVEVAVMQFCISTRNIGVPPFECLSRGP